MTETLSRYITRVHGSQVSFAKAQGVMRQQVTVWLRKEFIVVDGVMYSERRVLK